MGNGLWNKLASENMKTLYKQAVGSYDIEIVDEYLVPTVHVMDKTGAKTSFDLEKLALQYSDGMDKFYDADSGDEVVRGELNDRAVEAHLSVLMEAKDKKEEKEKCPEMKKKEDKQTKKESESY